MVSIPKNPFTPERQEELKNNAQEFLIEFSKEYLKAFGFCLLQKAIKDAQPQKEKVTTLKYRGWTSVQRPELFSGDVFFKAGEGPGTWTKWKQVYIAETQKYNIDVYKTEKEFKAGKKPVNTVCPCGYQLIKQVADHYRDVLREIGPDMGMTEGEIEEFSSLSPYAWACAHPLRRSFVFQLHQSKESGGCLCLGGGAVGDVEGLGKEEAKERPRYLTAFERCITKSKVRDRSTLKGKAFDRTCKKLTAQLENLKGMKDDGSEVEMLAGMIVRQCLTPIQKGMLEDLGAVPGKLKLTMWMKARGMVLKGMGTVVAPAWAAMEKGSDEVEAKVEPVISSGMEKIVSVKNEFKDKVREVIVKDISAALAKNVSPHLKKLFEAFDKPVSKAFDEQRKILEKDVPEMDKLPADEAKRNRQLDRIPRTRSVTRDMENAAEDIVELLTKVKEVNEDIFGYINTSAFQKQAEDTLLKVLDAAICTIEAEVKEKGQNVAIKAEVIKRWEHDVQLARIEFIKDSMRAVLLDGLMQLLAPVVDPVLDPIDDKIPDDMQSFLSVRGLYEELLDLLVGEPIDAMVDAQYPAPQ